VQIKKPLHEKIETEDFVGGMQELTKLRAPIDNFFDKVMVNCEDNKLRATRLGLLNAIRETMNEIADFSKIEG
jgi:glycyl-tRNA synthetase beta chain